MTRTEAVKMLNRLLLYCECPHGDCEKCVDAIDMAIEALEQDEIIRCKNCRHDNNCEIQYSAQAGSKFFCGFAEKRGSDRE